MQVAVLEHKTAKKNNRIILIIIYAFTIFNEAKDNQTSVKVFIK